MVVTSRDVAAQAGVSQATVSRVISGSSHVTEETRARVTQAMQRSGYQPNHAARSMRTQRSGAIGVVVGDILNPFYPTVVAAASRELSRRDYRMIVWESEFGGESSATEAIAQKQVDGVIFTTATPQSQTLLTALRIGGPTILVNREVDGIPCDQISSDNEAISFDIAAYFAAHGRRRVGLITADPTASTAWLREKGFRDGAAAAGLQLPNTLIRRGGFTHEGGHNALRAMLSARGAPPAAVFCVNDMSALGAIDAARSLGLRVPEDLWIAGYDGIDMASWEGYQLTTARQPIDAMVGLAVEILLDRVRQPRAEYRHYRFTSQLVVRDSTGNHPFAGAAARAAATAPDVVQEWST